MRYGTAQGYFLDTQDQATLEHEILTLVSCSSDKASCILPNPKPVPKAIGCGNVPQCGASRTNVVSNELEKKAPFSLARASCGIFRLV